MYGEVSGKGHCAAVVIYAIVLTVGRKEAEYALHKYLQVYNHADS